MENGYTAKGYEGLELSTQMVIREALNRGASVEVLDWKENFIRISKEGKWEYIKEATKTSLDTYITFHLMENKEITKRALSERGISVPGGKVFYTQEEALAAFKDFEKKDVVVKPNSTNFGTGITMLKRNEGKLVPAEYEDALTRAFTYDQTVLVEEYLAGKEYRFLVMGGEVIAVLHRVPANVEGDGIHSITELVREKNRDPLRGTGYKTPLEKIVLGEPELEFLRLQGKEPGYVPAKGERVFLRKNSNISTGGDSIDYTDRVHESYKKIAIEAAAAVNAQICGADVIIEDITQSVSDGSYGIIELNFNPALHIHGFPFKGTNRHPEKKVLDLLGF